MTRPTPWGGPRPPFATNARRLPAGQPVSVATSNSARTSDNQIEAYNGTFSRVYYVDNDGDVFADRSYNCGLSSGCFNAGSGADVAEALEPGDVVEIDPSRPGNSRRSRERPDSPGRPANDRLDAGLRSARCKGTRRCFGRTIGKALEPLDEGAGLVLNLVSLQ